VVFVKFGAANAAYKLEVFAAALGDDISLWLLNFFVMLCTL